MLSLVVLALAVVGAHADYPTSCPAGYAKASFNNYIFCYKAYSNLYNKAQAASQCKSDGATLAMIDDPSLNTFMASATTSLNSVYLGVTCNSTTSCIYDDGRAVKSLDYFYGGAPSPNTGNCVIMDTTNGLFYSKWVSVGCNSVTPFICQYDIDINYYKDHRATGCGAQFHLNAPVTISSPNYPQNYPNNMNCAYFFYSGTSAIRVVFNDFQTESGKDYLSVYGMATTSAYRPLTAQIYAAGAYSKGYNFTMSYTMGMAIFTSDAANTYRGFSVTFSSV